MKTLLERFEALTSDLESFEPATDTVAWVHRELLRTLDRAHGMLAALAADEKD